jgi:hypothetical protein
MRRCLIALAGIALPFAATQAMAAESVTTRIETRPYYGAVVTIEKGVRVYRPLPSHDRIIVNPTNAPVYIGVPNQAPVINQNATSVRR